MSNKTQKPKAEKPQIKKKSGVRFGQFNQDTTKIPEDIQKQLDDDGLEGRWVRLTLMQQYGGRHPKGWVPVKIKRSQDEISLFGSGPSDYFQRGDLVLAAKKKETAAEHRDYLRYEAVTSSVKERMKRNRQEFKDEIRHNNLGDYLKVVDGYDE